MPKSTQPHTRQAPRRNAGTGRASRPTVQRRPSTFAPAQPVPESGGSAPSPTALAGHECCFEVLRSVEDEKEQLKGENELLKREKEQLKGENDRLLEDKRQLGEQLSTSEASLAQGQQDKQAMQEGLERANETIGRCHEELRERLRRAGIADMTPSLANPIGNPWMGPEGLAMVDNTVFSGDHDGLGPLDQFEFS
ncbi:hypothetical protein BBP40_002155 [Aspergillus hancockii]|nr:hypothetical protein BBP40_002155 [Aspergillus hancockii]